ncbi:putative sulfate exporter family transporter [Kaistia dalseonensis]|uniref:Integral membrane protein (TIGR00698 family) n=1 Tax=Kaistia dalseonensis TaxID=410840 RepID=A0ABU0HAW7_9HYPH|nr:putative sulfate exporter family transporter [Kaistia dalseonensis]MCX5496831.1 putative sulfate exporter family transporter [Kaistia dalseonensis]MDQ0439457.1 putative integral membrane protein (TIGR00698 family) [Kaistia dalseonensis]
MPVSIVHRAKEYLPGLGLCGAVALAALLLQSIEARLFGRAWIEALVLAIILGAILRTVWRPAPAFKRGTDFSARILLEIAIVLLGASVDIDAIRAAGPALAVGVVAVVATAIATSYITGRTLGLPHRMALLVAAGNSICGNSAIAATAPVIGADADEVVSSIAFTAVLGVVTVLALPLLVPLLGLSAVQYGVLAGLTVYAVPQVLAATVPVAAQSVQIGTMVKLLRVLMLGPVVLALGMGNRSEGKLPPLHHLVPWFVVGFIVLGATRTAGLIPAAALPPIQAIASILTIIAMAALGLGVDIGAVLRSGRRILAAAFISLLILGAISLGLIALLHIP